MKVVLSKHRKTNDCSGIEIILDNGLNIVITEKEGELRVSKIGGEISVKPIASNALKLS